MQSVYQNTGIVVRIGLLTNSDI
uniref:Uncharacterized protein n=1 Tax=Anguilla anguilla TaxID=7936 RepID=A0A0E9V308_ANGAN